MNRIPKNFRFDKTFDRIVDPSNKLSMIKKFAEDERFIYYYDNDRKLRKFDKQYKSASEGKIRLTYLEGIYRWWKFRSKDSKRFHFI